MGGLQQGSNVLCSEGPRFLNAISNNSHGVVSAALCIYLLNGGVCGVPGCLVFDVIIFLGFSVNPSKVAVSVSLNVHWFWPWKNEIFFFPFTKILLSVTQKWSTAVKKSCDVWAKPDIKSGAGFLPPKSCWFEVWYNQKLILGQIRGL